MNRLEAYHLLHDGIIALSEVERRGIRIDTEYCDAKLKWIDDKFNQAERRFERTELCKAWRARFGNKYKYGSPQQCSAVLGADFHIKGSNKGEEDGETSADEEALRRSGVGGAELVLRMRRLKKMKDTLGGLRRAAIDGYAHPGFWLHTVTTYRSSSSDPNLQNIPVRDAEMLEVCRRAICPSKGYRLLEVDFKGIEVSVAACVSGDTKIDTLSGSKTIRQIIWMLNNGQKVYVFGYDRNKDRIAISEVSNGGRTRRNAEVWKVILDNGESIKATPDHRFLLRNGEYIRLDELQSGMSLMPLYRRKVKGQKGMIYRDVYLNNGEHIMEHNLVALDLYGIVIRGSNLLMHHWNHNGCDNAPDNLEMMTRARHMQIHSIEGWSNKREDHIRNHFSKTEEGKRFYADLALKLKKRMNNWTDVEREEFGKRISEGIARNGGRSGTKNGMYGRNHTTDTIKLISDIRSAQQIPSWCKGLTKETDDRLVAIGKKIAVVKKGQRAWNKGLSGHYHTFEATRTKLSAALTGRIVSDDTKRKLSKLRTTYWQQKENEVCHLCGCSMRSVTNTHLSKKHNMTLDQYKNSLNHKVVSVEFCGYEDVYNLNVEGIHNYAVSAGVIIKNCYHKDPTMLEYLRNPKSDMHGDMAVQIYRLREEQRKAPNFKEILRQSSKNGFVFPEFYGDYYGNCAVNMACNWLKMPQAGRWRDSDGQEFDGRPMGFHLRDVGLCSLIDFTEHMEAVEKHFWNKRFKVYNQWRKDWYASYQKSGTFEMKTGFTCAGLFAKNQVINYPVQGSSFHSLLWVLIRLVQRLKGWKSGVIAEVHDSALIDVHPDEFDEVLALCYELVEDLRREWTWLIAPMSIEAKAGGIDAPWADIKEL